jgi:hypothetical protein
MAAGCKAVPYLIKKAFMCTTAVHMNACKDYSTSKVAICSPEGCSGHTYRLSQHTRAFRVSIEQFQSTTIEAVIFTITLTALPASGAGTALFAEP